MNGHCKVHLAAEYVDVFVCFGSQCVTRIENYLMFSNYVPSSRGSVSNSYIANNTRDVYLYIYSVSAYMG